MALTIRNFSRLEDVRLLLTGHILGGVDVTKNPAALYLHGKTLIFNTPSATVTFAASPTNAQVSLTLAQVKTQIEAQATGVSCRFNRGRIELFMTTPGTINLDLLGTANGLLGFDPTTDTSAAPYNIPGGSAPALVQVVPDTGSNSFMVLTDE